MTTVPLSMISVTPALMAGAMIRRPDPKPAELMGAGLATAIPPAVPLAGAAVGSQAPPAVRAPRVLLDLRGAPFDPSRRRPPLRQHLPLSGRRAWRI